MRRFLILCLVSVSALFATTEASAMPWFRGDDQGYRISNTQGDAELYFDFGGIRYGGPTGDYAITVSSTGEIHLLTNTVLSGSQIIGNITATNALSLNGYTWEYYAPSKATIEAHLTGDIFTHTHSIYSLTTHDHNSLYATTTHNHDTSYLALSGGTLTGQLSSRAILPTADITYNLGGPSNQYLNIYGANVRGATVFEGGTSLVDKYLGIGAKAADSNLLDGIDSASFVRSDAADSISGVLTFDAIPAFNGGLSGTSAPFSVDSTNLVTNLNADLLDGYNTNVSGVANTIALRNASGYLSAVFFNSSNAAEATAASAYWYENGSDGYHRKKTLANVQDEIVTKAEIEEELTGAITTHTHSYLPLAGGTLTGTLTGTTINATTLQQGGVGVSLSTHNHTGTYYATGSKVADSELLDSIDSASFVRSDAADSISGVLTFNAIPAFNGGLSGTSAPFTVDSTTLVTNLNADLLDGNQASAFSLSGHTHAYLPLAGGTLTGTLTGTTINATTLQQGGIGVSLSGHTHAYLPLTGGTLTGATEVAYSGGSFYITDNATANTGVGGKLYFRGSYTGTTVTEGAYINLKKGNSTAGNYSFDLVIGTRASGYNLTDHILINSYGNTTFGGAYTGTNVTDLAGSVYRAYFDGVVAGTRYYSNVPSGTAPFSCTSTTLNTNLNADLLDGLHASSFIQKTELSTKNAQNLYQYLMLNSTSTGYNTYLVGFYGTEPSVAILAGSASQKNVYDYTFATGSSEYTKTKVGSPSYTTNFNGICALSPGGGDTGYNIVKSSQNYFVPTATSYMRTVIKVPTTPTGFIASTWDETGGKRLFHVSLNSSRNFVMTMWDETNDGYKTWTSAETLPAGEWVMVSWQNLFTGTPSVTNAAYAIVSASSLYEQTTLTLTSTTTGTFTSCTIPTVSAAFSIGRLYSGGSASFNGEILYFAHSTGSFPSASSVGDFNFKALLGLL